MSPDTLTTSWINQLNDLALHTPFGHSVKITIGVTPRTGERLAQEFSVRMPLAGVDGQGRPTLGFNVADGAVMIEWLAPEAYRTPSGVPELPPTKRTTD